LRKRNVQSKYLRLRRLTAELRGKDIELAKLLEDKMRIMSEMLAVVGTPDPLKDRPPDYVTMVRMKEESRDQSTAESRGSRSSLGGGNNYTKEQLLSAVQASYIHSVLRNIRRGTKKCPENCISYLKESHLISSEMYCKIDVTFSGGKSSCQFALFIRKQSFAQRQLSG
jgi:hypothetical protein